jgi:proline dehydrogenase
VDASDLLRNSLLQLAKSEAVRRTVERAPVSRQVVHRFVPGTTTKDAVDATAELRATNRLATIDYLGEDTTDLTQAIRTRDHYLELL